MSDIQQQRRLSEREIKLIQPDDAEQACELSAEETKALFQRYAPSLFAYLRQHTASREDAEDLLHEIFTAAMERPQFSRLGDAEQVQWLWRVARNKAVDTYRRKTRRPALELDTVVEQLYAGNEQSPEYALLRREEYAQLLIALQQLPPMQQEALRLRFVNELPCAEVAKVLDKREGAVRSMLSRAIARLRVIYTSQKEDL
jgi:RNA polymerase sigma-70 factor (ECF subfamily)